MKNTNEAKETMGSYLIECYIGNRCWKSKPNGKWERMHDRFRKNYRDEKGIMKDKWSFEEVVRLVSNGHTIQNGKFRKPGIDKKDTFKGAQFIRANMIIIDMDEGNLSIEEILEKSEPYIPSAIYKTMSHTEDDKRYRVLYITDEFMDREQYQRLTLYFINKLNADPVCKDPGRMYFGGKGEVYYNPNLLNTEKLFNLPEVKRIKINKHKKRRAKLERKEITYKVKISKHSIYENLSNLKLRKKPKHIDYRDGFNYINKLPLDKILGVEENEHFRCILPNHNDIEPSALVYIDYKGNYRYKCFGCGVSNSVVDTLRDITNTDEYTVQYMTFYALNIEFGSNYQMESQKILQENINFITSNSKSDIYKRLKVVNQLDFYIGLMQYFIMNLPESPIIKNDISLFASYNHIALFLLELNEKEKTFNNIANMKTQVARKVRDLTAYGLLKKINHKDLPEDMKKKSLKITNESGNKYQTTYWIIPKLSMKIIENALDMQDLERKYGYTKKVAGRKEMMLLHGKEKAAEVYTQDVMRYCKKTKAKIEHIIKKALTVADYFTKQFILDNSLYSDSETEKYIPGIAKELGYEYVRINKIYRKRYNICEEDMKTGSRLYVKQSEVQYIKKKRRAI